MDMLAGMFLFCAWLLGDCVSVFCVWLLGECVSVNRSRWLWLMVFARVRVGGCCWFAPQQKQKMQHEKRADPNNALLCSPAACNNALMFMSTKFMLNIENLTIRTGVFM